MGDDRLNDLVDHEAMVFKVDVPAPDGYASRAEYFAEVAAVLESLHHTHAHPIDQSVRGGTQTNGFLFRIAHPVVKQLEQQIRLAVVEAFKRFPLTVRTLLAKKCCGHSGCRYRFFGCLVGAAQCSRFPHQPHASKRLD